jgi:hypothetical protein
MLGLSRRQLFRSGKHQHVLALQAGLLFDGGGLVLRGMPGRDLLSREFVGLHAL